MNRIGGVAERHALDVGVAVANMVEVDVVVVEVVTVEFFPPLFSWEDQVEAALVEVVVGRLTMTVTVLGSKVIVTVSPAMRIDGQPSSCQSPS